MHTACALFSRIVRSRVFRVEGLDLPEFLKIKKIAENPSVPNGGRETGPAARKEHEPAPG